MAICWIDAMRTRLLLCILPFLAVLTGCALEEPTWVNSSRVEVHEEGFTDQFETGSLDAATLRAIGVNYYRYGNGPMDVAISYDPQRADAASRAEAEATRIRSALTRQGVRNLRLTTTPVSGLGNASTTLVSFPALTARPPSDCGLMPGYADAQTKVGTHATGPSQGYKIGCTVESLMAQQIARPGDLLGRPGFETDADARRQEAVVWQRGYYANTPNAPLEGERASDDD
jgi:pilus assembly protein CpaD